MAKAFQKMTLLALLHALVLCGTAAASREVKFKTLKPGGVNFTVEIPGESKETLVYVPVGPIAVQVSAWDLVNNNVRYQIVAFPKGKAAPGAPFELFSETFQRALAESPNSSTFDRKIEGNGGTALQYQIRIREYPGILRMYDSPKNFYAVMAIGATETDPSVSRFLSSFKLGDFNESGFQSVEEAKLQTVTPPSPWETLTYNGVDMVAVGILNGKTVAMPGPRYPVGATGSGRVVVRVLADERGIVTSALAVNGPSQFYDVTIAAALKARFKPKNLNGRGVKVSGLLVYDFKHL